MAMIALCLCRQEWELHWSGYKATFCRIRGIEVLILAQRRLSRLGLTLLLCLRQISNKLRRDLGVLEAAIRPVRCSYVLQVDLQGSLSASTAAHNLTRPKPTRSELKG